MPSKPPAEAPNPYAPANARSPLAWFLDSVHREPPTPADFQPTPLRVARRDAVLWRQFQEGMLLRCGCAVAPSPAARARGWRWEFCGAWCQFPPAGTEAVCARGHRHTIALDDVDLSGL